MNYFDHIEDYIHNRLSDKEREVFDNAIQNDAKLQEAVADAKLVALIGEAAFEEEVRGMIEDELQVEGEGTQAEIKGVKQKSSPFIYIVFSIVILSCLTWGYMIQMKKNEYKERVQFVMKEYTPPQVVFTRSAEEKTLSNLDKAKELFSKKEYTKAEEILLLLTLEGEELDQKNWLLGHIYFVKQDFVEAEAKWKTLRNQDSYPEIAKLIHEIELLTIN